MQANLGAFSLLLPQTQGPNTQRHAAHTHIDPPAIEDTCAVAAMVATALEPDACTDSVAQAANAAAHSARLPTRLTIFCRAASSRWRCLLMGAAGVEESLGSRAKERRGLWLWEVDAWLLLLVFTVSAACAVLLVVVWGRGATGHWASGSDAVDESELAESLLLC